MSNDVSGLSSNISLSFEILIHVTRLTSILNYTRKRVESSNIIFYKICATLVKSTFV